MSQIPSIDLTGTALRSTTPNGFSALSSEDFMRIMFTQLANQDPFAPSDSSALLEQMNSIRSIEANIDLMERLDTLVFENKLSSASNLIGKEVEGLSIEGDRVSGTVETVLRQGQNVILQLDTGRRLSIDNILTIREQPAEPAVPLRDHELFAHDSYRRDIPSEAARTGGPAVVLRPRQCAAVRPAGAAALRGTARRGEGGSPCQRPLRLGGLGVGRGS